MMTVYVVQLYLEGTRNSKRKLWMEDAERTRRSRTFVSKENVTDMRKMLYEVTCRQIEKTLILNAPAIHTNLRDPLYT